MPSAATSGGLQPSAAQPRLTGMDLQTRLYRSRGERILAGVAGGLATYLDLDPTLIRLAFLLLLFTTGPLAVLLYLACAIVVPREPESALV